VIVAALLLFAGCIGGTFDTAVGTGRPRAMDGMVEPGTLRLDVSPADDALGLLPQSFILAPADYVEVDQVTRELSPTVSLSGTLTADTLQGWGIAASASGPLAATVSAQRTSLRQGGAASTDENGQFAFSLPGAQPYSITITPRDATQTPLTVFANRNVGQDMQLDELISAGAPLYGRVADYSADERAGEVAMHLERDDTGARSATFYSDSQGWYVARAEPGYAYTLVVEGSADAPDGPIPTLRLPVTIEGAEGANLDVDVGARAGVSLRFRVQEEDGTRVSRPRARATSERLELGTLEVEVEGQDDGWITFTLPPGTWTIEVIPGHDRPDLSPRVMESVEVQAGEDVDLDPQVLAPSARLSGVVYDASEAHQPAADVSITAHATGYGGYTFSTVTDEDGHYTMQVPRTALRLEATPADPGLGAFTYVDADLQDGEMELDLDLPAGTALSGTLTSDGKPVPYAHVLVYDHVYGILLARTLTGADGSYAVRVDVPLAAGEQDTGGDTGP
jgi:hypothetical protein